jgi:hypothetical protein
MREKKNLGQSVFQFYEKELCKCVQSNEWKLVHLSMRAVIDIYIQFSDSDQDIKFSLLRSFL